MTRQLKLLHASAEAVLYEFERKNRAYFEAFIPSRGDDFYRPEVFSERLQQLLAEQERGEDRYYLYYEGETLIGRMNLTNITGEGTAEAGYRIGAAAAGNGAATAGLALLLNEAADIGLTTVTARATVTNPASVKVLERNGFVPHAVESIVWNGMKDKLHHYTCHIPAKRPSRS
ncbi:GNAT family N-acetyltransferase [Bacillus daqingensis]|uniref:GNAT family N-acetyltransferase n=1 Tax=Bacillus daqingensis TaxID=872396 RepID=A0ABV9NVQ6_9BACI